MKSSNYNIFYADNQLLFNSFSQCLLQIPSSIYEILKNENFDELDVDTLNLFKNKKIITESYEYERHQLECELNNAIHSHKNVNIVISFTSACNLNCWYCIENARKNIDNNKFLNEENWQKIKEAIVNDIINDETRNVDVVLYGGEPMLNKPMVLNVINDLRDIKNENLKMRLTLISNGTLMDGADEILKKVDNVQITIDATKENHNYNRPYKNGNGTFDDIYNSLLKYAFLYSDKFILRVNVTIEDYEKVINFMSKLKNDGLNNVLKFISFCPIMDNKCKECRDVSIDAEECIYKLELFAKQNGFKTSRLHEYGLCAAYNDSTLCVDENLNLYTCIGFIYDQAIGCIENGKIIKNKVNIKMSCNIDDKCKFFPLCLGEGPCRKLCCKEYYEKFYPKYLMLEHNIQL